MDAVDSVVDPLREFAKDSVRLVKRCHKPDRKEFTKVAVRTAIGFVVMGFVGFFVKLIFIPINNIIARWCRMSGRRPDIGFYKTQKDKSMNSGEVMVGGKRLQVQAAQGQPSLKSQKRKQKHLYLHPATLAYDTDTAALAAGPSLPDALLNNRDIFVVPGAEKLYAFGHHRDGPRSVEVMSSSSSPKQHPWPCSSALIPSRDWSWRSVAPLPFTEGEVINSYAVHPDGLFVSSSFSRIFSFDAGNGGGGWSFHGDWELPFEGQGYFDSDLDAWVGLDLDSPLGWCQCTARLPPRHVRVGSRCCSSFHSLSLAVFQSSCSAVPPVLREGT
ncbi:hypothetical protein QYE76_020974 [Lolium multiflorum]|uniref:Protein transport protein Sec61 subunit gamma n=1 Tax=Lolium multiflorum TaxID=4521 RepID=A0AAD8R6V9_LOLMU|nr:hypothetical protein QYE76_020974 [Lolium multiflorum]